jgi:NAD(P)-dependent dehydrogenase (short-subunit alcohol dehydrogenase family)
MMARVGMSERPDLPLAVVVGAGGLGIAVARRLGQHYRVLLADINAEHVERTAATLCDEGHDAISAVCDVTSALSVAALRDLALKHGPLRVLANVVGLAPVSGDWRAIMRVNLVGATQVADAMLSLAGQGTAAIFIGSNAGYMHLPDGDITALMDEPLAPDFMARLENRLGDTASPLLAYCHSKFALIRMCRHRAFAWGRRGARILTLSPGMIATPMGRLAWRDVPAIKYDLLAKTPLGREATIIEIADGVEFLASDRASFISGIDLLIDGGLTARNQDIAAPR